MNLQVDETDRAILEILIHNGRITNAELSAAVGMTPAPCLRRVRRMEEAGIIRGYTARVDPKVLGRAFEAIVSAHVSVNDQRTVEDFEEQVAALDEVIECRRLFGIPDYFMRVQVADADEYERFISTKLMALPSIARVNSTMSMKTVKSSD